jgi:hypothetical protein
MFNIGLYIIQFLCPIHIEMVLYDNNYNRSIAQQINAINHHYADSHGFSPMGQGRRGGAHVQIGNASKRDGENGIINDGLDLPDDYYYGEERDVKDEWRGLEGGSGFAEGTFRDTGYDHVQGAGFWDNFDWEDFKKGFKQGFNMLFQPGSKYFLKPYSIATGSPEVATGLTALGYGNSLEYDKSGQVVGSGMVGGRWDDFMGEFGGLIKSGFKGKGRVGGGWAELKSDIGSFDFNKVKDWIGTGKYHKLKGKGWDELRKDINSFDFNRLKDYIGLGKRALTGKGWDDFTNFFKSSDGIKNLAKKAVGVADTAVAGLNKAYTDTKKTVGLGKTGGKSFGLAKTGEYDVENLNYFLDRNTKMDKFYGNQGLGKHGGGLDEIKSDLSKADLNRLKDYLGLGKHGGGLDEIKSDLSKADLNRLKDYLGLGKGGARVIAKEKEKEKEEPKKPKEKEKEKEEPKKSLAHLFKTVNDKEEPKEAEAKAEEPKEKGYWGRFRESLGFGNKLAVMPDHQMMYSPLNPAKPVPEMKAKGKGKGRKLIPKAQLHSSTISGFGKGGAVLGGAVLRAMKGGKMPDESPTKGGRQARAEMVKKIMKEKGMKMIEASSYIKKNGIKY